MITIGAGGVSLSPDDGVEDNVTGGGEILIGYEVDDMVTGVVVFPQVEDGMTRVDGEGELIWMT